MKNNKGFTLVELLIAVSLLAILTLIAIPTLRAFQTRNDRKTYENYGKSMVASAKLYNDSYSDDLFGHLENGCQKVTLTEMINKKVAKDITLKNITCNKPDKDSYVLVWKYKNEYAFDSVINCENSKGVNQYEDKNEALAEACITATGKPFITVNTVSNEANNTKKKSVVINLNDEFGFTANQEIEYAFSTINNANGSGVTGYKSYKFNNSYIKRSSGTVKISTNSITIPSDTTGTYYLYVKPVKVQNIVNESITNIHKFGPYRFDHEPPGCPTIAAYKSDGTKVTKNTPAQISKFDIKFAADDLQDYEFKISYDEGSTWSSVTTYGNDKKEYTPTQDGRIIIKTRSKDYANNEGSWCTSDMFIRDTTPPSVPTVIGYKKNNGTDISSKGSLATHATNTWLKGWVFIQASGSTDTNGSVTYHYSAEGKTANTTDTEASYRNVNAEGTSTVKFWVCDSINNCSSKVSYIAKLDRTAPTGLTLTGYKKSNSNSATSSSGLSGYTASNWYNGYVLVVASGATDALGNGVNYYNGSTKTSYVNVNNQGTTTVKMKVCDNLSNCSSESSFVVKLDRCEATTTSWGSYGDCSKKCGGGTKTRKGTKYSTVTGHTDYKCSSDNSETDSASCNTQDCCSSVTFKDGTTCSKSCGGGTYNRLAYSAYDGSRCSSKDESSGGAACNTQACPKFKPAKPTISNSYNNTWTNSKYNITISTSSGSNKIGAWYYSWDNKNWTLYNNSSGVNSYTTPKFNTEINNTLYVRACSIYATSSTDSDNCSDVSSTVIKTDFTKPTLYATNARVISGGTGSIKSSDCNGSKKVTGKCDIVFKNVWGAWYYEVDILCEDALSGCDASNGNNTKVIWNHNGDSNKKCGKETNTYVWLRNCDERCGGCSWTREYYMRQDRAGNFSDPMIIYASR